MIPGRRIMSFDRFLKNAKEYPTLTTWKKAISRWSEKLVFEDHRQEEIPFDKQDPIHGKPTHVHVIDALEDMNVMPAEQYRSTKNVSAEWKNAFSGALKMYTNYNQDLGEYVYQEFTEQNKPWKDTSKNPVWKKEFIKKEFPEVLKMMRQSGRAKMEETENDLKNDIGDKIQRGVTDALTPHGMEVWNEFLKNYFESEVENNDPLSAIEYSVDHNEHGLIDVWRAVDYVIEKGDKRKFKDLYLQMMKKYKGVGTYWTWNKKKAETYWGSTAGDKVKLILYGKVAVQDVDWIDTIYKNGYNLREENEISIKGNVLIYAIEDDKTGKVIKLDTPSVVQARSN